MPNEHEVSDEERESMLRAAGELDVIVKRLEKRFAFWDTVEAGSMRSFDTWPEVEAFCVRAKIQVPEELRSPT